MARRSLVADWILTEFDVGMDLASMVSRRGNIDSGVPDVLITNTNENYPEVDNGSFIYRQDENGGFPVENRVELPTLHSMSTIVADLWSEDGGATWTAYRSLGFSGTSPLLERGPDETLFLFSRRHLPDGSAEMPAVEIRQSRDEGATWLLVGTLRDPNGTELTAEYQCGYPTAVASDGGLLVFFYSFLPGQGRFIAWNRIDFD